eukprot:244898-Lingulodinium_polyedra.AAC.1
MGHHGTMKPWIQVRWPWTACLPSKTHGQLACPQRRNNANNTLACVAPLPPWANPRELPRPTLSLERRARHRRTADRPFLATICCWSFPPKNGQITLGLQSVRVPL